MKKIVEYWRNTYDWRKQEAELNKFPQFKTNIEGIDIHFLRVKPKSGRRGEEIYHLFLLLKYIICKFKYEL